LPFSSTRAVIYFHEAKEQYRRENALNQVVAASQGHVQFAIARPSGHHDACGPQMNPEKLFDYLEGSLPEEEHAELEQKLATDPQLQRELAIAREMHRRARGSREVLGEGEDLDIPATPSGKLGRRLIAAFALLVLVNVLVGIAFIIGRKKPENPADLRSRELAIRQQLTASLQRTAESALPAPTLATEEIHLLAPAIEHEKLADNVVMLAKQCGGSAAKAPPDDKGVTVLADIPASREDEFRQAVAPLAATEFSSPTPRVEKPAARERVNIYVRITQASPTPNP
jgi:hypothetical protein